MDPLWFSVALQFEHLLGERADHVAVGLLLPAMKAGRPLHVGGVVTDTLIHQMNGDLQRLLQLIHPTAQRIAVTADSVEAAASPAAGVATGFSGGVDSLATLAEYLWDDSVPRSLRVTHLLNNNVGAHGPDGNALWQTRCRPLQRAAEDFGLPFVRVDSNLDQHYPDIGFLESVTIRNAAVPHLLSAGIGRLLVASAVPFDEATVTGSIAKADVMLAPLLSTATVTITSAGSGLTRVEKTVSLINRPEARVLDVCIDPDPNRSQNCSRCDKCLRTMLTLEIAGSLDRFCPAVFSRAPYAKQRDAYIAKVLSSTSTFDREIRAFANQRGWRWRPADRLRAAVRWARTLLARIFRRVRSGIAAVPAARALRDSLRR